MGRRERRGGGGEARVVGNGSEREQGDERCVEHLKIFSEQLRLEHEAYQIIQKIKFFFTSV
jgi:hypothetical protein